MKKVINVERREKLKLFSLGIITSTSLILLKDSKTFKKSLCGIYGDIQDTKIRQHRLNKEFNKAQKEINNKKSFQKMMLPNEHLL